MSKRVLVVSHAHPDFSKGGAEVAAYNLFKAVPDIKGWDAHFLARHGIPALQRGNAISISHNGGNETLFANETDHFYFNLTQPERTMPWFRSFLKGVKPDVVHFHHYWQVGLELLGEVKRHSPKTAVVVTLHEFLAVCSQHGQMLKTNGQLCRKSSDAECHACLPGRPPRDYFLRKRYLQTFFHYVDHFVSPSEFLRERYIEWGIPAEKISVIENGLPMHGAVTDVATPAATASEEESRVMRFGYFGQVNPFKGIDLLLSAAALLPKAIQKKVSIEVHGGGLEHQPEEFRYKVEKLLADAPKCVRYYGPYSQDDLPSIMGNVDWVVMPSIWWENSPVVIQESYKFKRPLIVGDIGGMAEKVKHEETGLHFRARNAFDLARVIQRAVTEPGLWDRLHAGIKPPLSSTDCADIHTTLYNQILDRLQSQAAA
ncbi:Glycosyltransferase involved in cell wall bisynthesis [Hydrocarboniphaga daqingensis]|jgi:glycosyltransferase involved in cell wall biosynthesis|uniref:Glycosyltransferase involved in cell wall bisynthesis n=1 Tax=Hydrocarboniphaga daqingensis TaxID=490188 RepID=A0A1M5N7Z0_9GAMM|nr:glycosyltransferase family 4 protein [Hydrocarboniphaga daqingensis]SHG85601.1 Glycosyltransferase involved in cell wall bisynthesis [Hydrocarboniphaga daqingensis]